MVANFDDLNILNRIDSLIVKDVKNPRSMPYEQYFGEMALTGKQVEERIRAAEELEDDFLFFVAWMAALVDSEETDYQPVKESFAQRWGDTVKRHIPFDDDYLAEYALLFASNAVDATLRHIDEPWYFSDDRAVLNAENESNKVFARKEYLDAVSDGRRTKSWQSLMDGRERHTHMIAHTQTVGLYEFFRVGAANLQFPGDLSFGNGAEHPEEIVNCRCTTIYN